MAISISSSDPMYFASLFGVDPAVVSKAKMIGVSVGQPSMGFLLVTGPSGVIGQVSVKGSAITLAKSGTLGPVSKNVIRHQLETMIVEAINKGVGLVTPAKMTSVSTGVSADPEAISEPTKAQLSALVPGLTPAQKAALTKAVQKNAQAFSNPPTPVVDIPSNPVKLSSATILNQPVLGTSASSTYYLVAKFQGCNVAIRRTKSKLSIRAEGPQLSNYATSLQSLGIAIKGDYASQHFEVSDGQLLRKTVGSLIGSMGLGSLIEAIDPINVAVKV